MLGCSVEGVWITTGGSSVWGHAFSLPLTDVLCQTSRMKNPTATICLTIAVLLGSAGVSLGQKDPILDKESAIQMFALSSSQWIQNVDNIEGVGIGRSVRNPTGSVALIYRPDPQRGLLTVTPIYKPNTTDRPFKIDVQVIFDQTFDKHIFESISFQETKDLLEDTARYMRPEFSVMGYLVRGGETPPSINFTIFRNGDFPPIDLLIDQGNVCPPRGGQQKCVLETVIGAPTDDEELLNNCVTQIKGSLMGIGKSKSEVKSMCSCVMKMGKMGKSLEEVKRQCLM